jgi:hypothetical protein
VAESPGRPGGCDRENSGLIQAMILVEGFTMKDEAENPCVVAR